MRRFHNGLLREYFRNIRSCFEGFADHSAIYVTSTNNFRLDRLGFWQVLVIVAYSKNLRLVHNEYTHFH